MAFLVASRTKITLSTAGSKLSAELLTKVTISTKRNLSLDDSGGSAAVCSKYVEAFKSKIFDENKVCVALRYLASAATLSLDTAANFDSLGVTRNCDT